MQKVYRTLLSIALLVLIFLTPGVSNPARSAPAPAPPMLRVGLSLTDTYLLLMLEQGDTMTNLKSGATISLITGTYRLENKGSGIQISDAAGKSHGIFSGPLQLVPAQGLFTIGNGRFGSSYRGSLEIIMGSNNTLTVVNIVDLESYLRGVVPREMPSSWGNYGGMEALKAQAVVARSYAFYYIGAGRHKDDPYDLCDTQHCQVYGGVSAESSNTDIAVAETRGVVLTWNGQVIAAFYHSTNGGHTECSANVWIRALPFLRSTPDPFDDPQNPSNVRHHAAIWERDVPVSVLSALLAGQLAAVPVESVRVESAFASGRVNELRISGGGQTVSFFRERARTALGLRSQLYRVREAPAPRVWIAAAAADGRVTRVSTGELEGRWVAGAHGAGRMLAGERFTALAAQRRDTVPYMAYIFEGRGWGHGIGMSQYGAYNRARAGQLHREILSFYFPGAQLLNSF
jgi:stage II sporulation protein D